MAQAHPAPQQASRFWRDDALPFIESRTVADGRKVCYEKHSHETFSLGVIDGGHSHYLNGKQRHEIAAGSVLMMNPGEVHACAPVRGAGWAYRMLYVDQDWLGARQAELGLSPHGDFQPLACQLSHDPRLYTAFTRFHAVLTAADSEQLLKESVAVQFFSEALSALSPGRRPMPGAPDKLARAVDFIHSHATESLSLQQICAAASLSPSYLIRAFSQHYHMTPHAYLLNCRIQHARRLLRGRQPLAEVAHASGFADQAHFQRVFKRLTAVTPGHYRR